MTLAKARSRFARTGREVKCNLIVVSPANTVNSRQETVPFNKSPSKPLGLDVYRVCLTRPIGESCGLCFHRQTAEAVRVLNNS